MSARTRIAPGIAAVACAAAATPAQAASPSVEAMVVGRSAVLAPAATVRAAPTSVKAGGRTCRVAGGTPLAVLAAVRRTGGPAFSLRDYGACSSRPRDASGLFVTQVGPDANRGQDGWVYKVDGRSGSGAAADVSGPFGTGRLLRPGQRVLWFWCDNGDDGCQRQLAVTVPARVAADADLVVRVRAHDERGRGIPVGGVTVSAGDRTATTTAAGLATLPGPWSGSVQVQARRTGLVASFPEEVTAG